MTEVVPTRTAPADRRLSPWSSYSVSDLTDHAPTVVRDWSRALSEADTAERDPELTDQMGWVLQGVGRWLASGEETIPDQLRALFRDLAFAYRSHGCRLDETLRDLESLEELLVGTVDDEEVGELTTSRELRRAMRALWTETIQLNSALSQRRQRERTDALESFEEILSHELGNRLGAARTGVDILEDAPEGLSEKRRTELLGLIGDGIDAALRTVDDVSAFVQAQKWTEDLHQPFDGVVAGVLKGVAPQARSRGVELRAEPEALPKVPVDAGRLRLILTNFLVNGIRYADEDEDERWVRLAAELRRDVLHLVISDNGIGIPEEEQAEVFRFHRRGRNHAGEDGSGLGLTIASEAITQLGGRVEMESEEGEGTTFRIHLPVGSAGGTDGAGEPAAS